MLNDLFTNTEYKALLEHIAGQYKGQAVLNKQQTAKLLSIAYPLLIFVYRRAGIFLATLKWATQKILV